MARGIIGARSSGRTECAMTERLAFGYRGYLIAFDPEPILNGGFRARAIVKGPTGSREIGCYPVRIPLAPFRTAREASVCAITYGMRWIDEALAASSRALQVAVAEEFPGRMRRP
jgi:hypothetical protein